MEICGEEQSTGTAIEVRRLSHPDFLIEVEVPGVATHNATLQALAAGRVPGKSDTPVWRRHAGV